MMDICFTNELVRKWDAIFNICTHEHLCVFVNILSTIDRPAAFNSVTAVSCWLWSALQQSSNAQSTCLWSTSCGPNVARCFQILCLRSEVRCSHRYRRRCGIRGPSGASTTKACKCLYFCICGFSFHSLHVLPGSCIKEIRGKELIIGSNKPFFILVFEVKAYPCPGLRSVFISFKLLGSILCWLFSIFDHRAPES